jgi:hypothetical protein
MANTVLAKMAVEISANTARFNAGLEKASAQAKKFENQLKTVGAAILGAIAFKEIGQQIISVTTQFEKFAAVLQNALGSRSAAQQALNNIKKFASETPFEVSEITAAYVRWTNQGLSPTIDKMRMLGDVASSLGAGFEQTAEAFKDLAVGQTKRIEEIGISAQQANGKIQLSFKGVNLEIEKNAKGVDAALNLYAKLPGVLGTSSAIAATMGGKISNLKDNLSILAATIGNNSSGLINQFLDFANNALGNLNESLNNQTNLLRKESAELNILVGAITSANTSEAARNYLIGELNTKYPDFLKNLNLETVSNEELKKRLKDVNDQFRIKIAYAAAQDELVAIQKELNEEIKKEAEAQKKLQQYQFTGNELDPSAEAQLGLYSKAQLQVSSSQKNIIELNRKITETTALYQKQLEKLTNTELDYFSAKKENTQQNADASKSEKDDAPQLLALKEAQKQKLKEEEEAWKNLMKVRSMSFEELKKQYKDQQEFNPTIASIYPDFAKLGDVDRIKKAIKEINQIKEIGVNDKGFIVAPDLSNYVKSLQPAIEATNQMRLAAQELNQAFSDSASQGLQDFFVGLGDVANKQISFGDNLLKAIAGFMKQFGQNLIALGIGKIGLDNLFKTGFGGPAAIAAGVALVSAAGAISKGLAKKSQSIGSGGSGGSSSGFSGQTISATTAQSNIQISGQLVGSGRDLVAVINNTSFDNKVRKGG